jgi:RHS repeat-associated protein
MAAQLSENSHQGFDGIKAALCLGSMEAKSNTASGMPVCLWQEGIRSRSSGKERDAETGLDYFLARYYSGAQGRFLSPDEFKGGPDDALTGRDIISPGPLPYADIANPQTLNKYAYVINNPLRYVDPDGHDLAIIENGPTEGNPIGHTAMAITGQGVFSFGNNTGLGSSLSDYISREAPRRDTTITIIKTTPEQDKAALNSLIKQDTKGGINTYPDNCAARTNVAMDAAGIPSAPGTLNPAGPSVYPADTSMPGTAGRRGSTLPTNQVQTIQVGKGSTTVPSQLKRFEPNRNQDQRLPKPENKKKPEPSS